MIREINTDIIVKNIKEMCIKANHFLAEDVSSAMKQAVETEKSELGKKIAEAICKAECPLENLSLVVV